MRKQAVKKGKAYAIDYFCKNSAIILLWIEK